MMNVWKISFNGSWLVLLTWAEVIEALESDFDCFDADDDPITIERAQMTHEEFSNLGEFEGW